MGRTCLMCFCERPNERFGGKGYGARVCKECRKLPKSEQKRRLAENEIVGFLDQKNISAKNVKRLQELVSIEDPQFQFLRRLIEEIAQVAPRRRGRLKILRSEYLDIYRRAIDAALIDDSDFWFDQDRNFEEYEFIRDEEFIDDQLDWLNLELRRHSSNVPPVEILQVDEWQRIAEVNRLLREAADFVCES